MVGGLSDSNICFKYGNIIIWMDVDAENIKREGIRV